MRHLDQLDVRAGQHPAVLVEERPVGISPTDHHPAAFGEGVGDRPEVEGHPAQVVPRAQRQVLVVKEQGDAFFLIHAGQRTPARRPCAGRSTDA